MDPEPLNRWAVVGLVVSVLVAVGGLFALPSLLSQGITFNAAFWFLCAVEFVAAVGVAYFVLNLHGDAGFGGGE
jgi:hypothetical protein